MRARNSHSYSVWYQRGVTLTDRLQPRRMRAWSCRSYRKLTSQPTSQSKEAGGKWGELGMVRYHVVWQVLIESANNSILGR